MELKLPTRTATALGSALTGFIALAQETHWSHELKQAVIIVGGLILALVVHPEQ